MDLDKRIHAYRADLAAASLKGKIEAPRFVEGAVMTITAGRASLRAAPSAQASQDSELLFGETVTVYDRADGWAWVQAAGDGYVGYLRESALGELPPPAMKVSALMAPVFAAADLKTPVRDFLPLNARVPAGPQQGDYVRIMPDAFVHRRHLAALDAQEPDFVAVAERFVGVPYVWGGKSFAGLDCSGLVQTALAACGVAAPRDTDMQEAALGRPIGLDDVRRGDLLFWKGHVGIALDADRLLHANAFHMQVAIEPLAEAVARIEKTGSPVTSVRRL